MRIFYFVNEAATPEDIRLAALLRAEGNTVTMHNARLMDDVSILRGVDRVVYNGISDKHLHLLEHYCGMVGIFCDPAIPQPPPITSVPLQLDPVKPAVELPITPVSRRRSSA